MLHRVALLAVLAVLLLAAPRPAAAQAPAPAAPVDIRVNSERVWVDTMQQAGAAVNGYTSKDGQPPTPTNFNVVRVLGATVAGQMETAEQVADIAVSRTFSEQDLASGYSKPLVQFPIGFGLSEVFFHNPELMSDNLRLDACTLAGILQGNITTWADPAIAQLNPRARLFEDPITLVYLNASFSAAQSLSAYLSTECPEGWPHGVVDNLADVAAEVPGAQAVADIQQAWDTVNKVRGALSVGLAMPWGPYQERYPNALQSAALRSADGRYVQPDAAAAAIVPSAIKELGAEAEAQGWDADWSFLAERAPTTYPLAFWGFAALPADLTGEGARGLYVRDSAGFLLTDQAQPVFANTTRYPLPSELKPAALRQLAKVKTATDTGVTTGIPMPTLPALPPPASPAGETPAAAAPPPSGARGTAAAAGSALFAALVAAALLLA